MKAMSKFFLIIAGILVVAGAVIMIIGSIMAKNSGVQLFQEKIDGKYIYKHELSDSNLTNIKIEATDANIHIFTGEEDEHIDFVNFNSNFYTLKTTDKIVDFVEHGSLKSLVSFWDGDFKFKGMRSIFSLFSSSSDQKEVNIYLKDTEGIVKFDFTLHRSGDIIIENTNSNTDYYFTLDDSKITLNNVRSSSAINVNGDVCTIDIKDSSFEKFEATIKSNIVMNAGLTEVKEFTLNASSGSVNADVSLKSEKTDVKIKSEVPFVYNSYELNGEYSNNTTKPEAAEDFSTVNITLGDCRLNLNVPEDTTVPVIETDTADTDTSANTELTEDTAS